MKEFSFDKRINIFCGHYGSGKSEISVNAAFMLKEKASKVLMADMDVVNPYYRSADARKALEDEGIKVVAPLFANTNVDVPAIGPEISIGLKDKSHNVIIDVGGDEDGSRVLGRYYHEIVKNEYDMFFVFNRSRPMTVNFEETLSYIREIEAASRLKITGLINNTHFLDQTTVEDIMYGLELAQEISQETLIPIRATCVMEGLEKQLEGELDHPLMVLRKRLSLPF
ncbi:MAG: ATP-binding protein [Acetivibrionales bacterium]|jgi:energy-coupling factor transporter ATP-binding protein EcfA2|nr:ATP-binding protein [Clostridiaceae bacterium]